eukprot:COSAG02_NODE_6342_length_3637_cov_6.472583_3_plen_65_part_00
MTVRTRETQRPLIRFVTSVCAIVGGILSTMGVVDKLVLWLLDSGNSATPVTQLLPTRFKQGVAQ